MTPKIMKPFETQYSYKKKIGFTETQRRTFMKLSSYGINANQFIRQAIKEKIERDGYKIIEKSKRIKNAPDWVYDD